MEADQSEECPILYRIASFQDPSESLMCVWSPCGKYLAKFDENSLMLNFYLANITYENSQWKETCEIKLVKCVPMGIPKSEIESLQQELVKDVPSSRLKNIALKHSSLSIALVAGEPVVALLGKNILKISAKPIKKPGTHQIFRFRKKFFKLQMFVHLWKPMSDPRFCKTELLNFNETFSNIREMLIHRTTFLNDKSFISLSPNGKFLAYSRNLEVLDKESHLKRTNQKIIVVDIPKMKIILNINDRFKKSLVKDIVHVFWSQDSQLLTVYYGFLNSKDGESLIVEVNPEKHPPSSLTFKEQALNIIWLQLNEYRVCLYNASEAALILHTVKKTPCKLTDQVFRTIKLGPKSSSITPHLSLTYDTFDRCYFFWARQRCGSSTATCDDIVISLPESALITAVKPHSHTTDATPQWPSLGELGRLSPQVHTLHSRVPASAPFAQPNPVHRGTAPIAVEWSAEGEPQLRVLSRCRSLYSPPSLRRLAARAMYAVPGALERWVAERRVPSPVLLNQLGCNSFNFGPFEHI